MTVKMMVQMIMMKLNSFQIRQYKINWINHKFRRILKLNNKTKMNGKKKKVKNLFAFSQAFLKIKRKKTIKLALKKYKEN